MWVFKIMSKLESVLMCRVGLSCRDWVKFLWKMENEMRLCHQVQMS